MQKCAALWRKHTYENTSAVSFRAVIQFQNSGKRHVSCETFSLKSNLYLQTSLKQNFRKQWKCDVSYMWHFLKKKKKKAIGQKEVQVFQKTFSKNTNHDSAVSAVFSNLKFVNVQQILLSSRWPQRLTFDRSQVLKFSTIHQSSSCLRWSYMTIYNQA